MDTAESYRYMSFTSAFIDTDYIWTVNDEDGGLYRISRESFDVELMLSVIPKKWAEIPGYSKIVGFKGRIILFPRLSDGRITVYNKERNSIRYIDFPSFIGKQLIGFINIEIEGKTAFLFPTSQGVPLIQFQMEDETISWDWGWEESIKPYVKGGDLLYRGIAHVGHNAWMPIYGSSYIVETDLRNGNVTVHSFEKEEFRLGTIAYDGENFWLSMFEQYAVISWNPKTSFTKMYSNDTQFFMNEDIPIFSKIICVNNKVFLLPGSSETILMIDKEAGLIKKLECLPEGYGIFSNRVAGLYYWGAEVKDNQILVYPASGNMMLIIDAEAIKVTGHKLLIPDAYLIIKQFCLINNITYEYKTNDIYTLESYCSLLKYVNYGSSQESNGKQINSAGTVIFNYIKNEM